MWASSNPILANDDAFQQYYGRDSIQARPDVISLQRVVNKTAILVAIAVVAGAIGYWLTGQFNGWSVYMWSAGAAFLIGLVAFFKLRGNPAHAVYIAPVYAAAEGVFLGALTGALDKMLAGLNAALPGGIALMAFVITISVLLAMLGLYSAKILRPTKMMTSIVMVATVGIMLTYLISWPLAWFFSIEIPFVSLSSALGQGWEPWIGLGLNVLILGVASYWLLIDFQMIEERIAEGGTRAIEWYCGFALLVTLAWIYYEAVKLAFRIAILISDRE